MTTSEATLRLIIRSDDAANASDDLNRLSNAAHNAEHAARKLEEGMDKAGDETEELGRKSERSAQHLNEFDRVLDKITGRVVAFLGAREVVDVTTKLISTSIDYANISAQALAQVEQGVESTSEAAKRSVEDILRLTSTIQNNTLFAGEDLYDGAANLLTFTNIAEEAFDRTLKAATDVSTRRGQDFKSTIVQLGKALNDPVANIGTLGRSVIQLTETQKENIESLVKQNKLFEAQTIILDELEKQYGGSAEAAREAYGGSKAATIAFGDFLAVIGSPIISQTNDEYERLVTLLSDPTTLENAEAFGNLIAAGMERALQALSAFVNGFNQVIDYLQAQGFVDERVIPIKFELETTGELLDSEGLQQRLLSDDEKIEIGVKLNETDYRNVQERIEQLSQQRDRLKTLQESELTGFDVAREAEINSLAVELKNLFGILEASADSTGGFTSALGEMDRAAVKTSDSIAGATNVIKQYNSGLKQAVEDAAALANAALAGPSAVEHLEKEILIRDTLLAMQEQAAKAGEAFDREREEQYLRELDRLEKEREGNEALYEAQVKARTAPVSQQIERFRDDVNNTNFGIVNPTAAALQQQSFERRYDNIFKQVELLIGEIDDETLDKLREEIREAGIEFKQETKLAADYLARSIQEAAANFVGSILQDIIFNGGGNVGDIVRGQTQRDLTQSFIDPFSDFLTGKTDDLFGSISEGLSQTTEKYRKIGEQLDETFGTDFIGDVAAGASAGYQGYQLGSGVADFVNGEQGKTGGQVGGAVGGGIGFAVAGPVGAFIGSAAGSFIGDLLGGLFGRKNASGSIAFDTGELAGLKESKKDSRNERRNEVLEDAFTAVLQLAKILDADLKGGLSLEVSAGKKSITTNIVDARGNIVTAGKAVDDQDVEGAVSEVIKIALNAVIEGGDPLLSKIASGFSSAGVPADRLLNSLNDIASVMEITKEPTSQFLDGLKTLLDVFKEGTTLAGNYAAATGELLQAQLEALNAYAEAFDESIADQRRRLEDPVKQDAIELAREQELRLREVQELNKALLDAVGQLGSGNSSAGVNIGTGGLITNNSSTAFNANYYLGANPDVAAAASALGQPQKEYLQRLGYASTPEDFARYHFDTYGRSEGRVGVDPVSVVQGTTALNELGEAIDYSAENAARLEEVLALNTAEWVAFIKNAADSPAAFKAASESLQELIDNAADGINAETLTNSLESVRASLAATFDEAQARRYLELTDQTQLNLQDLLDSQVESIEAAKLVSSTPEDLAQRLQQVGINNSEELRLFIQQSGNAADTLKAAAEALDKFADRIEENGANVDLLRQYVEDARSTLASEYDESQIERILRAVSTPTANLRNLLQRQTSDVEYAQSINANVSLVQRANSIELTNFLEALSDADLESIGDIYSIITEEVGRLPVVMRELDIAFGKFVDTREEEVERLRKLGERGQSLSEEAFDLRQGILRQYGGLRPIDDFEQTRGELLNTLTQAQDTTLSDEERLDAADKGLDVAGDLINQIYRTFGGLDAGAKERDRLVDIIGQFETISSTISDANYSLEEITITGNETLLRIEDLLASPDPDAVDKIADIVSTGQVQNQQINNLLVEFVNLTRQQQENRIELTQSIREAAIAGFSGEVSIAGTVSVDMGSTNSLLAEIRTLLTNIEFNQSRGGTESRLGLTA